MNNYLKILFLAICIFTCNYFAFSQQGEAKALVSKDSIVIGDVVKFTIEYDGEQPSEIFFPTISESLSKNILVVQADEPVKNKQNQQPLYYQNIDITSFDTGNIVIPVQELNAIFNGDTMQFYTDSLSLKVLPYMSMDTIGRDTIRAKSSGIVVFGKDAFNDELAQAIPDSIKRQLSADELKNLEDSVRNMMFQYFVSELYSNIGFRNDEAAVLIANGAKQTLFILDFNEIQEEIRIPGANDTIFVNEFDEVKAGQDLFVSINVEDIDDELFNTPMTWAEFWWKLWSILKKHWWWMLLSLAVILVILYFLFFRKKDIKQIFKRIAPQEPPHIIALRELERIRDEKKWQSGKILEFYSELTETLRRYLEGRFGIYAMEMTSDEIIHAISNRSEFQENHIEIFKQILSLADSVKFANAEPLLNENDNSLKNAFILVEDTIEQLEDDDIKQVDAFIEVEPDNSEEENQNV
ncbi:MAG: DUF4381 domain-containing protein [Bacteroidales bacterium]|nr:DUF4381 domain-containing protein [Bacteroidales bacterium]